MQNAQPSAVAPKQKRDSSIDLLRFIGISCIILAHIGVAKESALFQIRTFDVPLMVFISGLAYAGRSIGGYGEFAWRRTKRLLMPIYIFLIGYFAVNFILAQFGLWDQIPMKKITGSFLLRLKPSIGYVWVIRVFLIVMLLTPLLIRINSLLRRDWTFFITVGAMLAAQEGLIIWLKPLKPGWFVEDYLLYILGYSAMFLLGIRIRHASVRDKLILLGLLLVAFALMACSAAAERGTWLCMQSFKYPPHAYYLLWGGVGTSVMWLAAPYVAGVMSAVPALNFIGQNTIWIYLWHIPFVKPVLNAIEGDHLWALRYLIVYSMALLVFFIQYRIVRAIEQRNEKSKKVTKYFVG